jgi:hypothetical protein
MPNIGTITTYLMGISMKASAHDMRKIRISAFEEAYIS